MDSLQIGIVGIIFALGFILLRIPIGVSLGLVSIVGIAMLTSWDVSLSLITSTPYNFVGQWELSAAPMFLLMGYLCTTTNLTNGIFKFLQMLLYKIPGGLAISSVIACALFSAASGSSVATSGAMSKIAIPEMLKRGYNPSLATSTVAAAGTLGSLIPPSVILVLYGVYANVSIGQLFMAGVLPGLLTAFLFIAMIWLRCRHNPRLYGVDQNEKYSMQEIMQGFLHIWPLPTLIAFVIGGIFFGLFSPTEAGAIGSVVTLFIAALKRTLSLNAIKEAIKDTAYSTASIFLIMIGSLFFTKFLALSGVPEAFTHFILSINQEQWWVVLSVIILYLFLGMFIDSIGILLLTLPILLPLVEAANLNLIWFGILVTKMLEVGLVTPPVGLNVYVIKATVPGDIPLQTIFRGVFWFILCDMVFLLLIYCFPEIVTYLPSIMRT
ncbi:TRAP transporter large permease [Pelistega europaea]|uniref:TRAP transporter large permease protein n=1 Tax=Pelistega europaea TaxID=106147 RepID=A0A7Y4LAM9_9BURK|nr:TRAP transporter large permease [Pelistega europaea]NOL50045.1 TRAP transporter large permease [Pelistega europaea]